MTIEKDGLTHYYEVIDWDSQPRPIKFALELPFWLLVKDHRYDVSINDHTLVIETVCDGVDIQGGNHHSRRHDNQRYFGRFPVESDQRVFGIFELLSGSNYKLTKSQIWIETEAPSDAVAAMEEEDIRCKISHEYFAAVAMAHLPFINKFINGYRAATFDPFATEVTEFDVPIWFLVVEGKIQPVHLMYSLCRDGYPDIGNFEGAARRPVFLAEPEVIDESMGKPLVPGEAELLDAWSLCYRGRFSECIRSAVTAVEVLLEEVLRKTLQNKPLSPEAVESRLSETKNRFPLRLDDYCRASGRCVPGPILHFIPYLNGVRIREQFEQTRQLRHDVVHRGERLDPSLRNPIRRAIETTTWLFDWLAENADVGKRQSQNYSLFESWRGRTRMRWSISADGVSVRPLVEASPIIDESFEENIRLAKELTEISEGKVINSNDPADIPDAVFHATLTQFPDFEHFVLMALAKLEFANALDVFQDTQKLLLPERWRIVNAGSSICVFLFRTESKFEMDDYKSLMQRVIARKQELPDGFRAICIVQELKDGPWELRSNISVEMNIHRKATSDDITIIRADDLARFASATRAFGWSTEDCQKSVTSPGWTKRVRKSLLTCGSKNQAKIGGFSLRIVHLLLRTRLGCHQSTA